MFVVIFHLSLFTGFLNCANENDFRFLVQLNSMPQDMRAMLTAGFPRGFLGGRYGLVIIADEYRSSEPVAWYKQLWNVSMEKDICELSRDYPFNCFLFNVMVNEYIKLLRFSNRGPKNLAPEPRDLTVNFIFQYCRMRTLSNTSLAYDPRGYCPNPCFNKTHYCESMQNTKDGECEVDLKNPYRADGFKCLCKKDYIWSTTAQFCVANSSDLRSSDLGCVRRGTKSMKNSENQGFVCVCKRNYFGKKCENIVNACKYPVSGKIAGNAACRVNKGNKCLSGDMFDLEMDPFYQCRCAYGYRKDLSVPQDNCLYEYKPCEKWVCLHGSCVSISTQLAAKCICEKGWFGEHCDIIRMTRTVTPWNQWSICQPICGEARLRQRQRFCLTLFCDEYITQEVRPCRSRSCNRYHHPDSRDKYIMDVQLSDDERPEIDYFTLGMVSAVIANILLAAIFIQWRLFSPFLQMVGTRKAGMTKDIDTSTKPTDHGPSTSHGPQ